MFHYTSGVRTFLLLLALSMSWAWAQWTVPGPAFPAPYEVIGVTRNERAVIVVAYAAGGRAGGMSVLLNRDVQSGQTRWKRYVTGKLTVNALRDNGERLYAWAAVPGGHWEYVIHVDTGDVLNQIEVRHATPGLTTP